MLSILFEYPKASSSTVVFPIIVTVFNDSIELKEREPILLTFAGITTSSKDVYLNAEFSIDVTASGIVIDVNEVQ